MQRKLLVVFLLSSISIAVIIWLIAGQYANNIVLFKNLLLNLYLFLSIWILVDKLKNYGLALLFSVISILILGIFHSFWAFTAILVFLLIIFLYGFRKSRCSVKVSTCLDIFLISVISIVLALIAISGMARGYGNLWIDYKILNAALHIDTLFHVACANMINNYHTISTGLHGLPFIGNHVLSHFLYGNISNVLNVFTYQVYGYTTFIAFVPLLFLSAMSFAEELVPSKSSFGFYISFLLLISIFIGFLGRDTFVTYGLLGDSYFISESYLISLIMLYAFLSYLLCAKNKPSFILSLLFLIVLSASKISVGFMGLILLLICELFGGGDLKKLSGTEKSIQVLIITFKRKICSMSSVKTAIYILLFFSYAAYFLFFTGSLNNDQLTFEFLYFAKLHLNQAVNEQFGGVGSLIVFFLTHYFFVLLSIVLVIMYYFFDRNSFDRLKMTFLFLIVVTFVGFLPLCLSDISARYFSNISMFFAISIILSCKNYISKEAFTSNLRGIAVVTTVMVLFGMYGSLNYGRAYLIKVIGKLEKQKERITRPSKSITPYIRQLKSISGNDGLKKFLVYIPKQEADFWSDSDGTSIRNAFTIPAISGRPALFGLPHAKRRGYGYESYSKTLFNEARSDKICHERLCEETKRLGFEGYITVGSSSYEIINCKTSP